MDLPKVELGSLNESTAGAVIGWFQQKTDGSKSKKSEAKLNFVGTTDKEVEALKELLRDSRHFIGKRNDTDLLRFFKFRGFPNVMLVGLGEKEKWDLEGARQAGASIRVRQKKESLGVVSVLADSFFAKVGSERMGDYLSAFCEGYLLAGYSFLELKSQKPEGEFESKGIQIVGLGKNPTFDSGIRRAVMLAGAVNFARELGDRPSNKLTPTEFSKSVQQMSKAHGLRCTVFGASEIEKLKMGLFLGVAKGSSEEPRFMVMEHRGGKKNDPPFALVGKGITFDSGGISLKPASKMEDMKYDMMGAAAVAAICQAVADLKIPLNVTGYIAATENMPGGRAQKPGDVMTSSSGKTVEIINTDAEGRLILGDALEYAQKSSPQVMIDFATLTGSVVDALGTVASGMMGNHQGLMDRIKLAADESGERVWQLPLYDEYMEDLKSNVADIKNSGIREAGSCKGGTFLKFFVDSKIPWVHMDIAGSAYHRKDVNYHPQKFASGAMVRLILNLLENWKPL